MNNFDERQPSGLFLTYPWLIVAIAIGLIIGTELAKIVAGWLF